MESKIVEEERTCSECHGGYVARIGSVKTREMNGNLSWTRLDLSAGVCPECKQAAKESREANVLATTASARRKWRQRSGIPAFFMDKDFSNFEKDRQARPFDRSWEYAEGFPVDQPVKYHSFVMFSDAVWGVGKTHLACAIAHRVLDRWPADSSRTVLPVAFITEPELYLQIQGTYNFTPEERQVRESETDILNRLGSVPLLILDDLGKQPRRDMAFVQRTMFTLIDRRYRHGLPMVITTNKDKDGLNTYLGGDDQNEATYDRLIEMTGKRFIRLAGESYRRK